VFRALINDAKSAAGAVIGKYAIRVSVAVPFVIAAIYGTAAITLSLTERFGAIVAYCMMAGGFVVLGLIASVAVVVKEQEEEVADTEAAKADTADVATDAAAQAAVQLPLAVLGTLFTTPAAPGMAMSGAKMVARNLPLVVLLALIALLFWPSSDQPAEAGAEASPEGSPPPEAGQPDWQPVRNGVDRPAAA
jgi:hypothetical protein